MSGNGWRREGLFSRRVTTLVPRAAGSGERRRRGIRTDNNGPVGRENDCRVGRRTPDERVPRLNVETDRPTSGTSRTRNRKPLRATIRCLESVDEVTPDGHRVRAIFFSRFKDVPPPRRPRTAGTPKKTKKRTYRRFVVRFEFRSNSPHPVLVTVITRVIVWEIDGT